MALARVKTWSSGEILTASDLNAEFNNVLNNARDLISPLTASLDMNGFELIMDGDADSSLTADTDDRLDVRLGGVDLFVFDGATASCVNGITFTGVITGSGPTIAATGSDTNIPVTLKGKGTGKVVLGQATSTEVQLAADQPVTDSSGNELVKFSKAATAVNELTVANAATGGAVAISATGGDSNIPLRLSPKGTGDVQFTDGTDATKVVALELSGLTTATTRVITMPDVNVDLQYSRAASDTQSGAIEIATQAEVDTGTDTARAVTPATLKGRDRLSAVVAATAFPSANFVDITDIPQTFSALILMINGATSDTATRATRVQVSIDNGSNFDTTAGNYVGVFVSAATPASNNVASLLFNGSMTAAETQKAACVITGYQDGTFCRADGAGEITGLTQESSQITYIGSTSAINALRIIWNGTGNFDGGTYALYGVN